MVKVKRLETFDGVTIKVALKQRGFSVFIQIEEGSYLWRDRSSENCAVKFITPHSKRIAEKGMRFRIQNQSYHKSKQFAPFRKNFDLPSGGTCLLYLSPNFFLPEEMAAQYKRNVEHSKPPKKTEQLLFAPLTKAHKGKACSPIDQYHPYS